MKEKWIIIKIAVIADIHTNLLALNLALEDAKENNVEKYIFLGDYITDGEDSNDVLELVKQYSDYAIIGNREKYILKYNKEKEKYNNYKTISYTYNSLSKKSKDYIKKLKEHMIIKINNLRILLIHGDIYLKKPNERKLFYDRIIENYHDFDICLYGHSHIYYDEIYKGYHFINPGSIGQPTDSSTYKYCILNIDNTINVQLREFSVKESFQEFEQKYKNTKYYKENYIWSNLILDTIREGKDYCNLFLDILNSKLNNKKSLGEEEYNKIWEETFADYSHICNKNNKTHRKYIE